MTAAVLEDVTRTLRFSRTIPVTDVADVRKVRAALTVRRHTLLSYPRLANLYERALEVAERGIPGCIVECGAWNGGGAAMMASGAGRIEPRALWLFDSWEGLPDPDDVDVSVLGTRRERGWNQASVEAVRDLLLGRLKLDPDRVHLVKGWFEEMIPRFREEVGAIALLHVDADWYASVRYCLETLYDRVSAGGCVVVDDYGYWQGCRQAVDEFLAGRDPAPTLVPVDGIAVFLRKPAD